MLSHALVFGLLCVPVIAGAQGIVPTCEGGDPTTCNFKDLVKLGQSLINFLLKIAIPIFAVVFAWAGFLYLTAAGDTGKVKEGTALMKKAFIGFALALAAYLIVNLLTNVLLGGTDAGDIFKGGRNTTSYEMV